MDDCWVTGGRKNGDTDQWKLTCSFAGLPWWPRRASWWNIPAEMMSLVLHWRWKQGRIDRECSKGFRDSTKNYFSHYFQCTSSWKVAMMTTQSLKLELIYLNSMIRLRSAEERSFHALLSLISDPRSQKSFKVLAAHVPLLFVVCT